MIFHFITFQNKKSNKIFLNNFLDFLGIYRAESQNEIKKGEI